VIATFELAHLFLATNTNIKKSGHEMFRTRSELWLCHSDAWQVFDLPDDPSLIFAV